jgi:hypothetical protein
VRSRSLWYLSSSRSRVEHVISEDLSVIAFRSLSLAVLAAVVATPQAARPHQPKALAAPQVGWQFDAGG